MRRLQVICIVVCGFICIGPGHAQQPPKELVQYVREARKAGVNDGQLQENALKAGWSAALVAEAMQYARENAPPAASSKTAKEPGVADRSSQDATQPGNGPAALEKPATA